MFCKLVVLLVVEAFTDYFILKALNDAVIVRTIKLAADLEFEVYDSISKINSILKIK